MSFSAQAGFPAGLTEDPKPFDTSGTYTYPIPYWCTTIDLVLLGAGGGGGYGANDEAGGGAGNWNTTSVQRGSDIPWEATTITVTVGQGGAGGSLSAPEGGPGGDTTASWDSLIRDDYDNRNRRRRRRQRHHWRGPKPRFETHRQHVAGCRTPAIDRGR